MRIQRPGLFYAFLLLLGLSSASGQTIPASTLIDACEDTLRWKSFSSTGVVVSQHIDSGYSGKSVRFDIAFEKGSGYGGVIHNGDYSLPENYELSFMMRAAVPINNFEFKVSNDSSGEDIWWVNRKDYEYPKTWKRMIIKKRHLTFAWGPHPAPSPDRLRRIEIVVTAGSGGKGSVWIDELSLVPIPPIPATPSKPRVSASSSQGPSPTALNIFSTAGNGWSGKASTEEWLTVDLGYRKEFGAVRLDWDRGLNGMNYDILASTDDKSYDTLHSVRNGQGGEVILYTPESESRYVKLLLHSNRTQRPFHLLRMQLLPSDSIATVNQYLKCLAQKSPKGWYPRYLLNQASYWTVVGVASDEKEALISEDGAIEVDKRCFSIEPFIRMISGTVLDWTSAIERQLLADDYLPIPTVVRTYRDLRMSVTAVAYGQPGESALSVQYILRNSSSRSQRGTFFLAMRPFQVNPSYQWLNTEGGFARIDTMTISSNSASTGRKTVFVSGNPDQFGVTDIDDGDIVNHIVTGTLPASSSVVDSWGMASGAFGYSFNLKPGDSIVVVASVPFWTSAERLASMNASKDGFNRQVDQVRADWTNRLNSIHFHLPPQAKKYKNVLRSNLAYILINKDGPGFQPGSRSYERSWIRDGSMTSSALMKFGINADVRNFIQWYSKFQSENGMVPCVVDQRGPDPVPENDSHGEFIFASMEYFRFTKDTTFLRQEWSHIVAAVDYIQSLRSQRMTKEYTAEKQAFYGLVPESISHEGYSAKPMHSYWDDFFTLKGLEDAATGAKILADRLHAISYDSVAQAFQHDLGNSIMLAMQSHKIDFIPGCVELGDFDPTSTSISVFPCGALNWLPRKALDQTFEKYYRWFVQREKDEIAWDAFTPYEIRNVGTYVYLGQKERANKLLDWFLSFQRPTGWNDWAEVVWHDRKEAKFIGDMPHTWVGSDFINAFRAMFVYENDGDPSLVIGAGLRDDWVRTGLSIEGWPTHFGLISYSVKPSDSSTIIVEIKGTIDATSSLILLPATLLSNPLQSVHVDGRNVELWHGYVRVTSLPATVRLQY